MIEVQWVPKSQLGTVCTCICLKLAGYCYVSLTGQQNDTLEYSKKYYLDVCHDQQAKDNAHLICKSRNHLKYLASSCSSTQALRCMAWGDQNHTFDCEYCDDQSPPPQQLKKLQTWTIVRSEQPVSPISQPYIISNRTYERKEFFAISSLFSFQRCV